MDVEIDPPDWEIGMDQNLFFLPESQSLTSIPLYLFKNKNFLTLKNVMDYVRF